MWLLHPQPEMSHQQVIVGDGEFQAGRWERTDWELFHHGPQVAMMAVA